MPAELQVLICYLRRVVGRRELSRRSDRELLTAYSRSRDEEAFTALVSRHAGLVAGVCRRLLRNEQDIEDVFQATFLVLSRKAGSVLLPETLASWLHRVAFRLALRSQKTASRQHQIERNRPALQAAVPVSVSAQQAWELKEVLDHELARLPEACRIALILCHLEGRTRDQAARQSGWSLRTLDRRLEEGRQLLRGRLARCGLDLSVVVLAAALGEPAKASCAKLASTAVQFVMQHSSLQTGVTSSALKLANSSVSMTVGSCAKIAVGIVLAAALATAGVGIWGLDPIAARDPDPTSSMTQAPSLRDMNAGSSKPRLDLFGEPLPEGAVARLGGTRFHVANSRTAAYSADGKLLFACSQSGIRVFEAKTGRLIRNVGGDSNAICCSMGVSPDGKLAAIGGLAPSPLGAIFETATGRRVCEFGSLNDSETHVGAFSPDGALLAAIASRRQIDLYDSGTGKLLRSFELDPLDQMTGSSGAVGMTNVAFLPGGKTLLTAAPITGIVRILDVQTGKEMQRFIASPQGIVSMALSRDGARVAVLESDTRNSKSTYRPDLPGDRVMIFDVPTGRQISTIQAQRAVLGMAFSYDRKSFFTGTEEKDISVWDVSDGKKANSLRYPYGSQYCGAITLSPDGKCLARVGPTSIHVCDSATGAELESPPGHTAHMISIAMHPIEPIVATGGNDGRLLLWDRTSGRILREVLASSGSTNSVTFSPDGRFLFAIAEFRYEPRHSSIRCWDSASGKELWRLDDHPVQPSKLAIAPDGRTLAAGGDSAIFLIDATSGKPIRTLDSEGEKTYTPSSWGPSTYLAFTTDGRELLAWGNDKGIHRWNVLTGDHSAQESKSRGTNAVEFSPAREGLILFPGGDHLDFLDVASGKKVREIKTVAPAILVESTAFSPDGRTLAWRGFQESTIHLVDVNTGNETRRLSGIVSSGISLAFSSDGKTIVSDSGDGTALVWDLTKVPLATGPLNSPRP